MAAQPRGLYPNVLDWVGKGTFRPFHYSFGKTTDFQFVIEVNNHPDTIPKFLETHANMTKGKLGTCNQE